MFIPWENREAYFKSILKALFSVTPSQQQSVCFVLDCIYNLKGINVVLIVRLNWIKKY